MFEDFKNAFQRPNNAHVQLIIINVVVFVLLGTLAVIFKWSDMETTFRIIHNQFAIPPTIQEFLTRPWTIITYAFAHDLSGFLHILFNMLILYWFGRLFVEYLGSDKLIAVYVLGALFGAIFYLIAYNTIPYFVERTPGIGWMVGASAAVLAIVVGAATLIPNYSFYLLFFGPVKIKYIAGFYVVVSFLSAAGNNAGGNIAHLGGALIGFIYIKQLQAGVNWGGWITLTLEWISDLFKSKPKVKVTYRSDEPREAKVHFKRKSSKATQEEIDAILD
jgi:membrane associated rhomboid family serine protease